MTDDIDQLRLEIRAVRREVELTQERINHIKGRIEREQQRQQQRKRFDATEEDT